MGLCPVAAIISPPMHQGQQHAHRQGEEVSQAAFATCSWSFLLPCLRRSCSSSISRLVNVPRLELAGDPAPHTWSAIRSRAGGAPRPGPRSPAGWRSPRSRFCMICWWMKSMRADVHAAGRLGNHAAPACRRSNSRATTTFCMLPPEREPAVVSTPRAPDVEALDRSPGRRRVWPCASCGCVSRRSEGPFALPSNQVIGDRPRGQHTAAWPAGPPGYTNSGLSAQWRAISPGVFVPQWTWP